MLLSSTAPGTFVALSLCAGSALAQQYLGRTIPNSLPAAPKGSELTFFNIRDLQAGLPNATLINYYSLPGGQRQNQTKVQRAVILIHGQLRNPESFWDNTHDAMALATKLNPSVNDETVAMIAPLFPNEDDANTAYPFAEGINGTGKATTDALVWHDYFWMAGGKSVYPPNRTIHTFHVMDQLIEWFGNTKNFPNMKEIVVAGHSMGGQLVHRYAIVGKQLAVTVPLTYWVANPNGFVWLNSSRPIDPGSCTIYDQWSSGLQGYSYGYNTAKFPANTSASVFRSNYATRRIAYARGLADFGDASKDCSPFSQGPNRGERFLKFMAWFPPTKKDTVDYAPDVAHSDYGMVSHEGGLNRVFLDNFNGSGIRAPDAGERQVPGDNRHPASLGSWRL